MPLVVDKKDEQISSQTLYASGTFRAVPGLASTSIIVLVIMGMGLTVIVTVSLIVAHLRFFFRFSCRNNKKIENGQKRTKTHWIKYEHVQELYMLVYLNRKREKSNGNRV